MKNQIVRVRIICMFLILLAGNTTYCQQDTTNLNDMSLKDLLNLKIFSASKEEEELFDAPLSASVVTKAEIQKAGCTSVMEALRLVPGMIVREESNGNYDIHLRGMDNVPPNTSFDVSPNTTMLVMIDNRLVYSYLMGGTFWETLPVDINDVQRIEVVRGPAAALYGSNAVNGVINIITRHIDKEGLFIIANSQQGSNHTFIENASIGYRFNKKWNVITSGNYQYRERSQTSYFEYSRNKSLERPDYFITFNNDTVTNINSLYPDPELAMKKYAGNVFINYNPTSKINFGLTAGLQHSWVQRVSTENEITPLSNVSSDSRYADFIFNLKGLSAQVSYNKGTQVAEFNSGDKYDFGIFDASVEYSYTKGDFSLKPGLRYMKAIYDDTKYSDIKHRAGIFNSRSMITSQSASLRSEYKLLNRKLRLIAGLSTNTFNYPDAVYLAYQFVATYKVNKKHLLRAVYSKAPRSSNIFDTYVDQATRYFPSGNNSFTEVAIIGNKNLKLLTANMVEIGYRGTINRSLSVDVELFDMRSKNFNIPVQSHPILEFDDLDTVHETPIIFTNLPVKLQQNGITVSLTYSSKKVEFKPFITLQRTIMKNYSPYVTTPDADIPGAAQNNIYSAIGSKQTINSTPTVFGGASINYTLASRINISISAYYYSSQTYYHTTNLLFNDGIRGIDHISAKLILNSTISYEVREGLNFFCSGKNILNNKSREFFRTDEVPFRLLGGLHFEF